MGFAKLFQFSGRSSRSEYWWWYLFVNLIIAVMAMGMGFVMASDIYAGGNGWTPGTILLYIIILLVTLIAMLPITVRRLHDVGKGGGWWCISFIPFVGGIWLLVLTLLESEPHDNRFGPVPNLEQQNW